MMPCGFSAAVTVADTDYIIITIVIGKR